MKTYNELEDQYREIQNKLDALFGCSYGGDLMSLLSDLIEFSDWANTFMEDSKSTGVYDAVLFQRVKDDLERANIELRRLHQLASVGIAVEYLNKVLRIGNDSSIDYFANTVRQQAQSRLRDEVIRFLDMFKGE